MANRLATALQNISSMMPTADIDSLPSIEIDQNSNKNIIRVRLSNIEMSGRVRQSYDESLVESFAKTFKTSGFQGLLWVRPLERGQFKLIAGGSRYLGAERAQVEWVDALLFDVNEGEALDLELEENLKRRDFNDLETVYGILRSLEFELSLSREQIVALFSWNSRNRQSDGTHRPPRKDSVLSVIPIEQLEAYWSIVEHKFEQLGRYSPEGFRVNFLPLLKLPDAIKQVIMQGRLEGSKARLFARITDDRLQSEMIEQAIAQDWSREQINKAVNKWREDNDPSITSQTMEIEFSNRVKSVMKRLAKAPLKGRSLTKAERLIKELESLLDM